MSFFFIISFVLLKPRSRETRPRRRRVFCCDVVESDFDASAESDALGERDSLWAVIVKCDDICFTHILPRLNRTDLKFLYGGEYGDEKVGEEIVSQAGELREGFKVQEMSSISTVEVCVGALIRDCTAEVTGTNQISAGKLLGRINSSCSSGRERRKSVSGSVRAD